MSPFRHRMNARHGRGHAAGSALRFESLEKRCLLASLSIPQTFSAAPGESVTLPVELDSVETLAAPNRLIGSDLIILYDKAILTATDVTQGDFIESRPAWAFVDSIEHSLGAISIVAFTSEPLAGNFSGTLVNLHFTVNQDATGGTTSINLAETFAEKFTDLVDEGDGFLALEGPVTNASDDSVDGVLTIVSDNSAWQNPANSLDVDNSGVVSSIDVLAVVNEINLRHVVNSTGQLPAVRPVGDPFLDVTGDSFLSPTDVLTIINFLNAGAEGESGAARVRSLFAPLNAVSSVEEFFDSHETRELYGEELATAFDTVEWPRGVEEGVNVTGRSLKTVDPAAADLLLSDDLFEQR